MTETREFDWVLFRMRKEKVTQHQKISKNKRRDGTMCKVAVVSKNSKGEKELNDPEKIQYIEYHPTTKDPEVIAKTLEIDSEHSMDHGDIIDHDRLLLFNEIPKAVKEVINKEYNYSTLTEDEFDEWEEDLIVRVSLNIGIDESRGFEVHCQNYYFYHLDTNDEPLYVSCQGRTGREWLQEVFNHLQELGWNPAMKEDEQ